MDDQQNAPAMGEAFRIAELLRQQLGEIIVGQQDMLELLLAGLLAGGHLLIEGVPGVAKTLTAKLLAKSLDVEFSRIQFTPDLMPSDVTGTSVFHAQQASFQFRRGPIFANVVLIDEINRAPAKTQAALFEVMEERQVTVDGITYPMNSPFMVIATQNPIEHEGTYRLPEAQLDRFLMKINVGYPSLEEEVQILSRQQQTAVAHQLASVNPVLHASDVLRAQSEVQSVHAEANILRFTAQIIHATRNHPSLFVGASPRASIALLQVAKAIAVIRGRSFVIPDDVAYAVAPVLRHRVMLTPEREMEGVSADQVLRELLSHIEVPR
ncbi:MoxR family ATPase [Rurimicrobium arvi]|uniref:MoxR family ATPase n=2 Tax=Rurimicrobium arvi TaxID=2049916 RepID=A0ABP8MT76_9BACT